MGPFGFHPLWLVLLLVIVLIIFGPGKLPELGGAIGKGIREFRKTSSELTDEVKNAVTEQPARASAEDSTAAKPEQHTT
jgi:sec-independent protein translocase protein TatA